MKIPRILLAAGASGSGKTLITCGLLQAMKNRGIQTASFKCGPDYIDPMFHSKVIGAKSRNLDTFFAGGGTVRWLLQENMRGMGLAVMEGVMGYYDGVGGITTQASAYDLARETKTPVILIVNSRGMSVSLAAYLKGFLEYRADSQIQGVIFNQMSPMLYPRMKKLVEEELGIRAYGYVPKVEECRIESRHLGLVMPEEVQDLQKKLQKLAQVLEETLDLDGILKLAGQAQDLPPSDLTEEAQVFGFRLERPVRLGLARDEAFCFVYEDNLRLLKSMGAKLVEFSPLHDSHLPEDLDGLLLYGGYPELYAKELSENQSMRREIGEWLKKGLPCLAECGGFMYLHEQMEGMDGKFYPMAGAFEGSAYRTPKLNRFGYVNLRAEHPVLGEDLGTIRAHEFHYFDSENCGCDFQAQKPVGSRGWRCMHGTDSQLCGFPHLYYCGSPQVAAAFLKQCGKTQARRRCENPMGAKGEKRKWQE